MHGIRGNFSGSVSILIICFQWEGSATQVDCFSTYITHKATLQLDDITWGSLSDNIQLALEPQLVSYFFISTYAVILPKTSKHTKMCVIGEVTLYVFFCFFLYAMVSGDKNRIPEWGEKTVTTQKSCLHKYEQELQIWSLFLIIIHNYNCLLSGTIWLLAQWKCFNAYKQQTSPLQQLSFNFYKASLHTGMVIFLRYRDVRFVLFFKNP